MLKYTVSTSSERLTIRNPYDDSLVTSEVQIAGQTEIDAAVAAAQHAYSFGLWSKFTGAERAACMLKFADLVEQNKEELAYLETISMGKPISVLLEFDIPHMIGCYRCTVIYV